MTATARMIERGWLREVGGNLRRLHEADALRWVPRRQGIHDLAQIGS